MLTKTSLANPDKATAYGYLMTNLIVLPGAGTMMAGKKTEGICQIILAVVGMTLTISGIFMLLVVLMKSFSQALAIFSDSAFWMTVGGILIFLIGWLWSAWSVYPLVRAAKKDEKQTD